MTIYIRFVTVLIITVDLGILQILQVVSAVYVMNQFFAHYIFLRFLSFLLKTYAFYFICLISFFSISVFTSHFALNVYFFFVA